MFPDARPDQKTIRPRSYPPLEGSETSEARSWVDAILTVEFKTNLLAPAEGERFFFRVVVVKPGRTLTVCEGRAFAEAAGVENLIAPIAGTLMALPRR